MLREQETMITKWTGVSGSWRYPVPDGDVEREILAALDDGKSIVTGGALGVDSRAARTALNYAMDGSRLKIILPTGRDTFILHHYNRARLHVITVRQADKLAWLLEEAKQAGCIVEHPERAVVNKISYYARNQDVVDASDELLAFRVNDSAGTGDTIARARVKGIPVKVFTYRSPILPLMIFMRLPPGDRKRI
jgi:hypothetical protein